MLDTKARLSVRFFTFWCQVCEYFLHKTTNIYWILSTISRKKWSASGNKTLFLSFTGRKIQRRGESAGMFLNCLYWRSKIYLFSLSGKIIKPYESRLTTAVLSLICHLSLECLNPTRAQSSPAFPGLARQHHSPSLISYLQQGDINLIPWSLWPDWHDQLHTVMSVSPVWLENINKDKINIMDKLCSPELMFLRNILIIVFFNTGPLLIIHCILTTQFISGTVFSISPFSDDRSG